MSDTSGAGVPRIKDLLNEALDLEGEARVAFLAELERSDESAHARVVQLLEAHTRSAGMDSVTLHGMKRPSSRPTAIAQAGDRLGPYEIVEMVGSGGGGVVYRARQAGVERTVALKVLAAGRFATEEEVRRFRAEAEVVARLDHPAIVPLYEVGEQEGRHYFSMKLIEGESLAAAVARFRDDPRAAVELLSQVARAVQHGHERGILHRDLKPSNILLDEDGAPYVADFGVAKRTDADQDLTRSGGLAGTPAYMAPEQFTGKGAEATVHIDVYGLGCLLFEALTGRPVFSGETTGEIMQRIWSESARFTPAEQEAIPRDLRTIALRCLEKQPERRYPSAAAMADDLDRWLAGEPIHARHVSLPERLWLHWKRKPLVTSLVAGLVVMATVILVGSSLFSIVLNASLKRAIEAEDLAQDQLRNGYLATARATRRTPMVGRRFESLDLLQRAAAIEPGADLRDEAIAAMALADLRPEWVHVLPGEGRRVVAVDRKLELAAVGLADHSVQVHRMVDDFPMIRRIEFPTGRAWSMRFSRDGRLLAAKTHGEANQDPRLYVWDLQTGATLVDMRVFVVGNSMEFLPGGEELIVGLTSKEVVVLRLADSSTVVSRPTPTAPNHLRLSPDGRQVAVAGGAEGVTVMTTADLNPIGTFQLEERVYCIGWSPDGEQLVTGHANGIAQTWRVADQTPLLHLSDHKAEVVHTEILADGRTLATYSWDGTMLVYDLETGAALVQTPWFLAGVHTDEGRLAYTTSGTIGMASVHRDDVLRVLHGHTSKGPSAIAVSPDGRWVASGAGDGTILWDLRDGGSRYLWEESYTSSLAFHPRTGQLYAGTGSGVLRWPRFPDGEPVLIAHGPTANLSFPADGALLASRVQTSIRLHSPESGEQVGGIRAPGGTSMLAFSPDGRWLSGGAWRGKGVKVWSVESKELLTTLEPEETSVAQAFSPDSRYLLTGNADIYRLYRVADWEVLWSVERVGDETDLPGSMAFSPDGGVVAIRLDRVRIQLLDAATGEALATLESPDQDPLTALNFTADGDTLVVGSTAMRIQVWDLGRIWSRLEELELTVAAPLPRD